MTLWLPRLKRVKGGRVLLLRLQCLAQIWKATKKFIAKCTESHIGRLSENLTLAKHVWVVKGCINLNKFITKSAAGSIRHLSENFILASDDSCPAADPRDVQRVKAGPVCVWVQFVVCVSLQMQCLHSAREHSIRNVKLTKTASLSLSAHIRSTAWTWGGRGYTPLSLCHSLFHPLFLFFFLHSHSPTRSSSPSSCTRTPTRSSSASPIGGAGNEGRGRHSFPIELICLKCGTNLDCSRAHQ